MRLLLGVFSFVILAIGAGASGQDRPNIILFLVDDLGWQDVSVPMREETSDFNRRYRTPHLASLAARGVVFANAYASSPVCTPTRVAIMTGKSPARTGVTYWTLHQDTDTSRNHPTLKPPQWSLNGLQPGEHETLPALLSRAGYATFQVGKAHFGTHGTPGSDPTNLGFDATVAGHASGAPASYYGEHSFSRAGRSGNPSAESPWDVPGLEAYHGRDVYLTEALAEEAVRLIEGAIDRSTPFFLWFSPYAVHTPIMANRRLLDGYADLHPREAAYATMVETVDNALGALLASLERHGQTERTIIIFWSDNGGLSAHARGGEAHTHNAPARSGKGSAYDGGIRSPGVIAWAGVTDGGRLESPAIAHDLMPTILSMGGLEAPDGIDGADLTPLLRREGAIAEQRVIGWHMPHQWGAPGPGIEPFTAIRRGRYKLIYFHAGPRLELYDLEVDVGEADDLAGRRPELLAEMSAEMDAYIERTGAALSVAKTSGEAAPMPSDVAAQMGDRTEREDP